MVAAYKSGLYALVRTDGAPLVLADLTAFGFQPDAASTTWHAMGRDGSAGPAHDTAHVDGTTTMLVGDSWDPDRLINLLRLPPGSSPARIAAAALAQYGPATPLHLPGEWTLFHRRANGQVTVMLSAARRDPLLYAQSGARLACAPDLFALARLDWVDTAIDETGLLAALGRPPVRQVRGARTILRGVRELPPGATLILTPAGTLSIVQCPPAPAPARFAGTFADAVELARAYLLAAMRQRLERYPDTAILLSGGLDSSLLAWLARACGADAARVVCITSAAPEGSGLADETRYAALVAGQLGLPLIKVAPGEALQAYRPDDAILASANGPPLGNRHFLTSAFQQAAAASGSQRLLNGTFGELTATRRLSAGTGPRDWRRRISQLRQRFAGVNRDPEWQPFHVRLAPHRLGNLPPEIRAVQHQRFPHEPPPADAALLGFAPGSDKALSQPNEFYAGAIRMEFPFRDPALLHLFAGFPRALFNGERGDRGAVRALLNGQLPDEIRLRRTGMPASPDHLPRLQRHAAAARTRISAFRAAEIDDWIDLNWLDQALAQLDARGTTSNGVANAVQLTAIAAEFLLWWRSQT